MGDGPRAYGNRAVPMAPPGPRKQDHFFFLPFFFLSFFFFAMIGLPSTTWAALRAAPVANVTEAEG